MYHYLSSCSTTDLPFKECMLIRKYTSQNLFSLNVNRISSFQGQSFVIPCAKYLVTKTIERCTIFEMAWWVFLVNVYVVVKYLLSYFFAMSLITFTCSSITNDKKILINAKYRIPNLMSLNSVFFLFSFLVLCLFSFFLEGGAFNLADQIFKTCYLN